MLYLMPKCFAGSWIRCIQCQNVLRGAGYAVSSAKMFGGKLETENRKGNVSEKKKESAF